MGRPRGRPTKYRKKYCEDIIKYFSVEPQETVWRRTYFSGGGVKSEEPVMWAKSIPTFQGFAQSIGVHTDTLKEWAKQYPEFSEAYARARMLQEKIWLINAMSGLYNAQFAQFFGKNCLGYKDRQEINANIDGTLTLEQALKKIEGEEY